MINTLGVAQCCLLGGCPMFVTGTGREMSSLYVDINTNFPTCIRASIISGSVPFLSVPGFPDLVFIEAFVDSLSSHEPAIFKEAFAEIKAGEATFSPIVQSALASET